MVLPAKAENVAVVRHALAGLAEGIGMDEVHVADLKTVVSEACMNVVVHAYEGRPGPLDVQAVPDEDGLTVVVRDEGVGIKPKAADFDRDSLRLGLSLIAALSGSFSISGSSDRGTEITMRLPLGDDGTAPVEARPLPEGRTEVVIDRPELLAPILARVVGAFVARCDLSVDRVSDAILVSDAIAVAAPEHFAGGRFRLGLDERAAGIDLRLGPMGPEVGGSLESLADELAVEESDDGEYLVIRFAAAP